jgi:hypothetical protein
MTHIVRSAPWPPACHMGAEVSLCVEMGFDVRSCQRHAVLICQVPFCHPTVFPPFFSSLVAPSAQSTFSLEGLWRAV